MANRDESMTLREFIEDNSLKLNGKPRRSKDNYKDSEVRILYLLFTRSFDESQNYLVFSKTAAVNVLDKKIQGADCIVKYNDGQWGIQMPDSSEEVDIDLGL